MTSISLIEPAKRLWEPCRYKVMYGGRGGGKSWAIARALLMMGASKPLRILCTREFHRSIKDSVHLLMADQVRDLDLGGYWEVGKDTLISKCGSQILFVGLKEASADSVKSMEGVDICWLEEAQMVSEKALQTLIPTIRKPSSEIWVSMNPMFEDDPAYKRFVRTERKDCIKIPVSWRDNPWMSGELEEERKVCMLEDPSAYANIWEGECVTVGTEAILKVQAMGVATQDLPFLSDQPVWTAMDIGMRDPTSIWFGQYVDGFWHLIDYWEQSDVGLPEIVKYLDSKPYVYGGHFLPHDGKVREWGSNSSRLMLAQNLGLKAEITPRARLADRIQATKIFMGRCKFSNETARGLKALQHWSWDLRSRAAQIEKPRHDWASHGADAFSYFALSSKLMSGRTASPHSFDLSTLLADCVGEF